MKIRNIIMIAALMMLMTACVTQKDIDQDCWGRIQGDYQAVEQNGDSDKDNVGGWWHLWIGTSDGGPASLSIYDNGAGNPGIEGEIITLNETEIVIKYDEDLFEDLPSGRWMVSGGKLSMTYDITDRGIELTNNEHTILFKKDGLPQITSGHWKAEDSKQLDKVLFENDQVCLEGWHMDDNGVWDKVPTSYFMSQDCKFIDKLSGGGEISCAEFQSLLASDKSAYSVVELEEVDGEVTEVRLVSPDESRFSE